MQFQPQAPIPRAFIGIPVPQTLATALQQACSPEQLQAIAHQHHTPIYPIPICNWHITLRFLGAVRKEQLRTLYRELGGSIVLHAPFSIEIQGLIAFPTPYHPKRIAWHVVRNGPLQKLYETVEAATQACGYLAEKRAYRPHLSIGKPDPNTMFADEANLLEGHFQMRVDKLILYESKPSLKGSTYNVIREFKLG